MNNKNKRILKEISEENKFEISSIEDNNNYT